MKAPQRVPGVEARAGKFPGPSLIPALNAIQARLGWLPREELEKLALDARRPRYEIEGLISFYPHFRTSPPPPVSVSVCHDLSCFLHDGEARIAELRERHGDAAGDGQVAGADRDPPAELLGDVLHEPLRQGTDRRCAEAEQGPGLVGGVALEIPP